MGAQSESERYLTKYGQQKEIKNLAGKTHHERQKGHVCNFFYQLRSAIQTAVPKS